MVTLTKWPNREKAMNFWSHFSYKNVILLIRFYADFKIFVSFKNLNFVWTTFQTLSHNKKAKNSEITPAATKIDFFAQYGILGNICDSFWIHNRPNIGVYIVFTISIFFPLALGNRKMSQAAKYAW